MGAKSMFVVALLFLAVTGGLAATGFFVPKPDTGSSVTQETAEPADVSATPEPVDVSATPQPTETPPPPTEKPEPIEPPAKAPQGQYSYTVSMHYLWYDGNWKEFRDPVFDQLLSEKQVTEKAEFDMDEFVSHLQSAGLYKIEPTDRFGEYYSMYNNTYQIGHYQLDYKYNGKKYLFEYITSKESLLLDAEKTTDVDLWFFAYQDGVAPPSQKSFEEHMEPQYYYQIKFNYGNDTVQSEVFSSCCDKLQLMIHDVDREGITYYFDGYVPESVDLQKSKPDSPEAITLQYGRSYPQNLQGGYSVTEDTKSPPLSTPSR
jgi:hypothetical protein